MKPIIALILLGVFCVTGFPALADSGARGDAAIAEKYVIWAEDAIAAGQWTRARAALERASDFADVSSDVSYLLALARVHTNDNRGSVLRAVQQAIRTGRWSRYSEMQARLLEAEQLIAMRRYSQALNSIAAGIAAIPAAGSVDGNERAEFAILYLAAMKNMSETDSAASGEFRRAVQEAMELFPRDPGPLRFFFCYARNRRPDGEDLTLMDQVLKRLPFLIEQAPELAWMAAPFIGDTEEARRLVAGYRSGSFRPRTGGNFIPSKASIIPALNLGLLDDFDAIDELFFFADGAENILDKDIIVETGDLLRSDEGRDRLIQRLLSFTGVITEDRDRDGIPESRAVYKQGVLQEFYYDAEQGGLDDIIVLFNSSSPQWAEITALPAAGRPVPNSLSQIPRALVFWERYPAVQRVVMGGETFLFTPGGFHSTPVNFEELGATGNYAGLLFPRRNYSSPGISLRMLVSAAYVIQRPNAEFEGGTEQVFLRQGLPVRSEVTLDGRIVSVTEFENGRPVIQRADITRAGRMDTVRRFRRQIGDPLDGYPWVFGPDDYLVEIGGN